MRYTLENEILAVEIDSFGAELRSIRRKADDFEYMWQADPRYWGRTSPVLFPFVGVPKDKEYRYAGKTYPMGQHGFARDMEFTLEHSENTKIWFALASTEETLAKYPFAFRLHIGYMKAQKPFFTFRIMDAAAPFGSLPIIFELVPGCLRIFT